MMDDSEKYWWKDWNDGFQNIQLAMDVSNEARRVSNL